MKKFYIGKSSIAGKGIFSSEDIKKEEKILTLTCKTVRWKIRTAKESQRFANWIGLGNHRWLNTNPTDFRYLNHSCEPNAAIIEKKTLIALKDIRKGDEIYFDYSMTDDDIYWKMECKCGTKSCRGVIFPIFNVPKEVFKAHYPNIPNNFQRIFIRHYIESN